MTKYDNGNDNQIYSGRVSVLLGSISHVGGHSRNKGQRMIEEGVDIIPVHVFAVRGGLGQAPATRDYLYDAEIVPYINDISKERDPMVRQKECPGRFLHLSTLLIGCSNFEYEDSNGFRFGPRDIIAKLYEDCDYDY
jgi:hypothetical protein